MKSTSLFLATLSVLLLSACGGSGSGGDDAPAAPVVPSKAVLTVSPASIELIAQSAAPVMLTVTNTSSTITATSIAALLPSSWTDVVQDATGCASLPPRAQCTLSFMPGDASHPQATVNISGHNTETASVTVVVSPFNGAVIEALTATMVSMEPGQTVTMGVANTSATITARNISARLAGTALAGNVTQDASDCAVVLPGQVCHFQISSGNTTVSPTSFSIRGDNTSAIGGSIAITLPTSAQLSVLGSPMLLQATSGTPVAGSITITNNSTVLTATNIRADLSGTALDGNVTQDASACVSLPPQASCLLAFTPGSTEVAVTAFTIQGDNTSLVGASMFVNAAQATLSVSGAPLELFASGVSGSLVVTNTSGEIATDIASNFTGTALDGNVAETSTPCAILAPSQSCMLTFTPGSAAVPSTSFTIAGSNTNTVTADMTIQTLAVGDSYAGGIVLMLPSGGTPGTIVAAGEVSLEWGGYGITANALDLFDGPTNTAAIVTQLGANGGTPYAAGYCDGLSESAGGVTYDDWYLPSYNDLAVLIFVDSSSSLGIFSGAYWSSSEFDPFEAYAQTTAPSGATNIKTTQLSVRCARAFTL